MQPLTELYRGVSFKLYTVLSKVLPLDLNNPGWSGGSLRTICRYISKINSGTRIRERIRRNRIKNLFSRGEYLCVFHVIADERDDSMRVAVDAFQVVDEGDLGFKTPSKL